MAALDKRENREPRVSWASRDHLETAQRLKNQSPRLLGHLALLAIQEKRGNLEEEGIVAMMEDLERWALLETLE